MFRITFLLLCFSLSTIFASSPILIGIAGGTGSGKTYLANKILKSFPEDCILISQDSYYHPLTHLTVEERAKVNFDHPNSIDFEMLKQNLCDLLAGNVIEQPIYNFHIHDRESYTHTIAPSKIIIVEGILLFAQEKIKDLFDVKIYVETDADVRLLRRIERDIKERSRHFEDIKLQYLTTVKPMHEAFVEPSKKHADVLIPGDSPNQVGLQLILINLQREIESQSPQ